MRDSDGGKLTEKDIEKKVREWMKANKLDKDSMLEAFNKEVEKRLNEKKKSIKTQTVD